MIGDREGLVEGVVRRPDVEVAVEDQKRPPHGGDDALGIGPGRVDEPLAVPAFGDVAEDEDDPDDVAARVTDGRRTVVDGPLAAVAGDEEGMVSEPDG